MKLTVITAAFRISGVKKIIECLENQTFKDFHHIIINDGQEDIRSKLTSLCDNKTRFWVDVGWNSHYYGAFCRNIGVNLAFSYVRERDRDYDNELVTFLDDDNLWENNHLETMVNLMADGVDMVISDARWIGTSDTNWSEIRPYRLRQGAVDLGQILYKRKLFTEIGNFNPRPRRKHKFDFELIKKFIDNGCRVVQTNQPTFIMSYRKK